MTHPIAIVAVKTITLVLGGAITYLAARAARRTGSRGLWLLSAGFGVVTLGSLLAGVVDQLVAVGGHTAPLVDGTLTAVGFAVITYSLYVQRRSG